MTKEDKIAEATPKKIGVYMKNLRLEHKLTQKEFAAKARVSVSEISKMERGDPTFKVTTLMRTTMALGKDPREAFYAAGMK